jgi:hypothetical protein
MRKIFWFSALMLFFAACSKDTANLEVDEPYTNGVEEEIKIDGKLEDAATKTEDNLNVDDIEIKEEDVVIGTGQEDVGGTTLGISKEEFKEQYTKFATDTNVGFKIGEIEEGKDHNSVAFLLYHEKNPNEILYYLQLTADNDPEKNELTRITLAETGSHVLEAGHDGGPFFWILEVLFYGVFETGLTFDEFIESTQLFLGYAQESHATFDSVHYSFEAERSSNGMFFTIKPKEIIEE